MKEESTFIDWQRAKVQETTDEVRAAHRAVGQHVSSVAPCCADRANGRGNIG